MLFYKQVLGGNIQEIDSLIILRKEDTNCKELRIYNDFPSLLSNECFIHLFSFPNSNLATSFSFTNVILVFEAKFLFTRFVSSPEASKDLVYFLAYIDKGFEA